MRNPEPLFTAVPQMRTTQSGATWSNRDAELPKVLMMTPIIHAYDSFHLIPVPCYAQSS